MMFMQVMFAAAPLVALGFVIGCVVSIVKNILSIRRMRRIAREEVDEES